MHLPGQKLHREFFRIALDGPAGEWSPVPQTDGLIVEMLLADDLDTQRCTGTRTRLARWQPGALIPRPVVHDFHEEVFVVEGDLVVGCDAEGHGGESFGPHTFACRPPGALHGPFTSRGGCVLLEFQHYG